MWWEIHKYKNDPKYLWGVEGREGSPIPRNWDIFIPDCCREKFVPFEDLLNLCWDLNPSYLFWRDKYELLFWIRDCHREGLITDTEVKPLDALMTERLNWSESSLFSYSRKEN